MRVALIATGERDSEPAPVLAGRSLVLRQFDFARACGVERVIAYGDGAQEDAQALRQEAGRARIAHASIASAHALVSLVDWGDELLVLQPGVLPESRVACATLGQGHKVLALTPRVAGEHGFERIDAGNYWAGALTMPGALVDRLEQLPEDADPHAALLRIALQERLQLAQLPPELLAKGRWARLCDASDVAAVSNARMRLLARERPAAPSHRLAEAVLARFIAPLMNQRYAPLAGAALALLLLCAAIAAAWFGLPAWSFAALGLAVPLLHLARMLDRLRRAAFGRLRMPRFVMRLPDAVLLAAGVLSIEGSWFSQLFPPMVLVIALSGIRRRGAWRKWVGDRALGALLVAGAALAGAQEPALMAWALLALAAGFGRGRPKATLRG